MGLKSIYWNLFIKGHQLKDELNTELEGNKSFLDIACGINTPIKEYTMKYPSLGIDIFQPSIDDSKKKGLHTNYKCMNIISKGDTLKNNSFDCVIALDLIEHLEKEEGYTLISTMERIAKRKVIIFTPNGFVPQFAHSGNKDQEHKCGWSVSEFEEEGFRVIGVSGLKYLKGSNAELKFKPKFFWRILSHITQLIVRNHPRYAYALLAIKDLKQNGSK